MILSGEPEGKEGVSHTGVGFVIAPWAVRSVMGFHIINDRIAALKLRMVGGKLRLLSAYAPHSGYRFQARKAFFDELERAWKLSSQHCTTVALGDLNAKLFHRALGDEDVIGEFFFRSPMRKDMSQTNRELLVEVCRAVGCCIANTYYDHPPECLVTCRALGTAPRDDISAEKFSQIDHCLLSPSMLENVADIWADRDAALRTQHFLMQVFLQVNFPKRAAQPRPVGCNPKLLCSDLVLRNSFAVLFCEQMADMDSAEDLDTHAGNVASATHTASKVAEREGRVPKRPWISQGSLDLIEQREEARKHRWVLAEKDLHRRVRASIKQDRKR